MCISLFINTIHAYWFSSLVPVNQKIMEQDMQTAWNKRMFIGFCGGFCVNAFCQEITIANMIGGPVTAAAAYSLNKYTPIITKNRQWLEITNAYIVGALAGRLARMEYYKIKQKLNKLFNKPEARVVITQRTHS